jgi:hypothetical protein
VVLRGDSPFVCKAHGRDLGFMRGIPADGVVHARHFWARLIFHVLLQFCFIVDEHPEILEALMMLHSDMKWLKKMVIILSIYSII